LYCFVLAQGLAAAGYELVSTGGSAKAIEAAGVAVGKVEDLTGFPEMLDGEQQQQQHRQMQ
jgi:phosphoribosylaminoimidazolecarboxamide formyltransferase/IMP cyclohydrolase